MTTTTTTSTTFATRPLDPLVLFVVGVAQKLHLVIKDDFLVGVVEAVSRVVEAFGHRAGRIQVRQLTSARRF